MPFQRRLQLPFLVLLLAITSGCVSVPDRIVPVTDFELDRYLGKWYEIARLDHSFERGLEKVSAEYSLREDGGVKVLNRGFDTETKTWEEAEGRAYFVENQDIGFLKVAFFGPFFGSYIIFDLDHKDYQHAYICGPKKSYLWFLSRTPTVTKEERDHFTTKAESLGFPVDQLIWVDQ